MSLISKSATERLVMKEATLPTISKPCLTLTASGSSHTKMAENIDGALLALLRRPTAINVRAVIRPETMPPTSKPHKSGG
jgi:hypothetical protein